MRSTILILKIKIALAGKLRTGKVETKTLVAGKQRPDKLRAGKLVLSRYRSTSSPAR